ncbi:MAG TPA: DUF1428 domain-containing protein [Gemmatimonadales bacterium]|nr:DUF1428 domain-containing protein [Gemmatimonadales bacterium]
MRYVDAYVIPLPKRKLKAYETMARVGKRTWMKHGALEYMECVAEDMKNPWGTTFPKLAKVKKGETLIVAFVVYKSRAHRDRVNAKVMKEFSEKGGSMEMPFDVKRSAMGGFRVLVGT